MSLSTLLDTATMAKLFETRDHIRASLIKSARTDGTVNTITLKDDTSYDDDGNVSEDGLVVLVNDSGGFGCGGSRLLSWCGRGFGYARVSRTLQTPPHGSK